MASRPPDHLLDWKLETPLSTSSTTVTHISYISGSSARERRVAVQETWKRDRMLGIGTYGTVWVQRCSSRSSPNRPGPLPSKRAVKEMRKTLTNGQTWDYVKELEAVVKFSHARFVPFFVQAFGWWETDTSIFIAMEYLPLGDLHQHMSRPFSESETRQIISQVLEGVHFMHESGFAHRDLKPLNILVESNTRDWLVKIADFGCSKRSEAELAGGTELRTGVGTIAYMAPEVQKLVKSKSPGQAATYSLTVDVWAIGVICYELLCHQHPFSNIAEFYHYSQDKNLFPVSNMRLSTESCIDFVRQAMCPDPDERPSSKLARQHPWLSIRDAEPHVEIADSDAESELFVEQDDHYPHHLSPPTQTYTATTVPSLAWSGQQDTILPGLRTPDSLALSTLQEDTNMATTTITIDRSILTAPFASLALEEARYFVLRSNEAQDIESSAAHNVWTATERINKVLNRAFLRAHGQPILLIFSVTKSRKFCGVALMTTFVDFQNTDDIWVSDEWTGRFGVDWIWFCDASFDHFNHIPVKNGPGYKMISCYDGTEIKQSSGLEALTIFSRLAMQEDVVMDG